MLCRSVIAEQMEAESRGSPAAEEEQASRGTPLKSTEQMRSTKVFSGEGRNLRGALNEASGVADDYYYRGKPLSNGTVRLQQ